MDQVKKIALQELSYFKALYPEGRKLILSYSLYNTMDPLLWTFATAFLFRLSHNLTLISLYYIAIFIGLVLGFYINGKLLNRITASLLFLVGCITQALVIAVMIFLSPASYTVIFILGFLFGSAAGIFWANRTFLTITHTESDQRLYFTSLESTTGVLASVIIPAVVGFFIVFDNNSLYSAETAYKVLSILIIFVMTIVGLLAKNVHVPVEKIKRIPIKNPSMLWQKLRLFTFIEGMYSGIIFILPTVLILRFIGNESSLGLLQSGAAIVSAVVLYAIGTKAQEHHRLGILAFGVLFAIVGWIVFGITYSGVGVFVYTFLASLGDQLRVTATNPISYDIIDIEEQKGVNHHFSYIFDWELFLDTGRAFSLLLFILCFTFFPTLSLRIGPIVFAMCLLIMLVIYKQFEKYVKKHAAKLSSPQSAQKPEYTLD